MAEHAQPEMLRLSLQDLALRIKIMKIGNSIEDVLLRALDPPLLVNIQRAIASLIEVGHSCSIADFREAHHLQLRQKL